MARKKRTPEENARREKIRELVADGDLSAFLRICICVVEIAQIFLRNKFVKNSTQNSLPVSNCFIV